MTSLSQDAGEKLAPLEADSGAAGALHELLCCRSHWVDGFSTWRFPGLWIFYFLFSAVSGTSKSWLMAEINAMPGIKQQSTAHAGVGDVRGVCWWKWYCRLQCVFNSYLLSFLMKPRLYHQHEVEWVFISHASTELSARSNYTVLWEAARAQLDVPTPDLRCLQGRHLRK